MDWNARVAGVWAMRVEDSSARGNGVGFVDRGNVDIMDVAEFLKERGCQAVKMDRRVCSYPV